MLIAMNRIPSAPRFALWHRVVAVVSFVLAAACSASTAPLKVLFLGDSGLHVPATRLRDLAPDMIARGIQLVYTEDTAGALTPENLKRYQALLIYANTTRLEPTQEQALLDYVTQGGGLVAVHCASAAFGNSDRFIALVGGRFKSHQTGTFRTRIAEPDNPVMRGFTGFESWDETYVHDRHNETNRTVLEYREDEPWTWIRREGQGRVFYTAWGHDQRTWTNPGFHDLIERGIRYAAGQPLPGALATGPAVTPLISDDLTGGARVPFYSNEPGSVPNGGNPWTKMQRALSAPQSMEHIVVPGGFELQLFASEPDIQKPITMAWDERGRAWIVETVDYPNRLVPPGEPGHDRIVICEDTNHDGKADKFTVFAEHLNVPTALTFANGGVIVHQMPNTLFLKDTDGDDKADVNEVLMTGWGRNDTHAGPSNLQYGPDNWIWGVVGYSGFNGTVGGKSYRFSQGFYRFKPDGSAIEFPRNTNNNTWGLGFSETGVAFASTANNNPSVYLPIAARYYEPAGLTAAVLGTIADTSRYLPITPKVREVDVFWGYTAGAGHNLYTARTYPKEYWNRVAFVAEPTGHLVGQFILEADGGNYRSHNPTNLLASDDEWCAPIFADVGPDGNVWVIDWYNYIIQHNPVPRDFQNGAGNAYENELRDHRHGRIYRVVWKDAKPTQPPALHNAKPEALVAALRNDNLFWRRHAQRLLVERGRKDVVPALVDLLQDQSVDDIGLNVGAIHALWTLQGLNAVENYPGALAATTAALKHPSAGVRRNAIGALPRSTRSTTAILDAGLLKDTDGQVRLAAMLALADSADVPAAGQALHDALAAPGLTLDRWSGDAAKMAATAHSASFLAATKSDELAAARAALTQGSRVLLESAALASSPALPANWTLVKNAGEVEVSRAAVAHSGAHSLRVALKGEGASGGMSTNLKVKRNFRYELLSWVKTEGLPGGAPGAPGARGGFPGRGGIAAIGGATLVVPQLQGGRGGAGRGGQVPSFVRGTSDWMQIRVPVTTTNLEEITVVCTASLGSSGTAAGAAWFDEVALRELGPADESVSDPLHAVINHLESRNRGAVAASGAVTSGPAATVLNLGVIPDVMKYDKAELTVKAGTPVRLVFRNNDHMQHNVLLLRPGTLESVGALADQFLTDPRAMARNYVPETPNVLANSPLVNPGETAEINFTAPATPGRYPYMCTFPGHWRLMQGTLVVVP
jgi:putative membrane-bound dehydrogenase-like protein